MGREERKGQSSWEVLDIGFEDYINSDACCFMEWPEMIEGFLPEDTVKVTMEEQDDGSRTVTFDD